MYMCNDHAVRIIHGLRIDLAASDDEAAGIPDRVGNDFDRVGNEGLVTTGESDIIEEGRK